MNENDSHHFQDQHRDITAWYDVQPSASAAAPTIVGSPKSKNRYVLVAFIATLLLVAIGGYVHSSYAERQHQAALANADPVAYEPEQIETGTQPVQSLTPEIAPPPLPSPTLAPPPPPPSPSKDPVPAPEKDAPRPVEERPTQTPEPSSPAPGCKPCPGGTGVYPAYPTRDFGSRWDYGNGVWVTGPAWYPPVKVRSHEVGWLWVWDCNDFFLRPPH